MNKPNKNLILCGGAILVLCLVSNCQYRSVIRLGNKLDMHKPFITFAFLKQRFMFHSNHGGMCGSIITIELPLPMS